MTNSGSGSNGEYTFLDVLNILSFIIAMQNYNLNIDQNDMQEIENQFSAKMSSVVDEIHKHLQIQDDKIDEILSRLDNMQK